MTATAGDNDDNDDDDGDGDNDDDDDDEEEEDDLSRTPAIATGKAAASFLTAWSISCSIWASVRFTAALVSLISATGK